MGVGGLGSNDDGDADGDKTPRASGGGGAGRCGMIIASIAGEAIGGAGAGRWGVSSDKSRGYRSSYSAPFIGLTCPDGNIW